MCIRDRFYIPDQWRGRADDKKQGSGIALADQDIHIGTTQRIVFMLYESMLKKGVCPEQARMVLPQNTMTEWYWSGSLDAFADMCNLRCKEDTQFETSQAAQCVSQGMKNLFPISWEALQQ